MSVVVVLGTQFGDEGKAKVLDYLCSVGKFDLCARAQGGSNAGHTTVIGSKKYALHLVPAGILVPNVNCLIGHGCVVNLEKLESEIQELESSGISDVRDRLFVAKSAHIVTDECIQEDIDRDKKKGLGTTKQGIGPTYARKMHRDGLRMDSLDEKLGFNLTDGIQFMMKNMYEDKRVLVEGANATMLDIDVGTYPYVTSSNTTIGGIITGLSIPPRNIKRVVGVVKAYLTRVGAGIFPTELFDDVGNHLQTVGHEFGTTTGRPRRCGWLDMTQLRYACFINGTTDIALTKLDVLSGLKEIRVCVAYRHNVTGEMLHVWPTDWQTAMPNYDPIYQTFPGWEEDISGIDDFDDLPLNARKYINYISSELRVPILIIGVGPERTQLIITEN